MDGRECAVQKEQDVQKLEYELQGAMAGIAAAVVLKSIMEHLH